MGTPLEWNHKRIQLADCESPGLVQNGWDGDWSRTLSVELYSLCILKLSRRCVMLSVNGLRFATCSSFSKSTSLYLHFVYNTILTRRNCNFRFVHYLATLFRIIPSCCLSCWDQASWFDPGWLAKNWSGPMILRILRSSRLAQPLRIAFEWLNLATRLSHVKYYRCVPNW